MFCRPCVVPLSPVGVPADRDGARVTVRRGCIGSLVKTLRSRLSLMLHFRSGRSGSQWVKSTGDCISCPIRAHLGTSTLWPVNRADRSYSLCLPKAAKWTSGDMPLLGIWITLLPWGKNAAPRVFAIEIRSNRRSSSGLRHGEQLLYPDFEAL